LQDYTGIHGQQNIENLKMRKIRIKKRKQQGEDCIDGPSLILLLLQSALQPLVGFWPAQLSLSILSRKVLLSAVASGTSNPQHGGEPGI
jgi:hypothetical protein